MADGRDTIEPERFHAAVRAHVNDVVAGAGHHPGEAYTPAAYRHYVRRRALRASWAITEFGVWPGASASSTLTDALPGSPAASSSAVCFARTSGLVKISSIVASSLFSP